MRPCDTPGPCRARPASSVYGGRRSPRCLEHRDAADRSLRRATCGKEGSEESERRSSRRGPLGRQRVDVRGRDPFETVGPETVRPEGIDCHEQDVPALPRARAKGGSGPQPEKPGAEHPEKGCGGDRQRNDPAPRPARTGRCSSRGFPDGSEDFPRSPGWSDPVTEVFLLLFFTSGPPGRSSS